ncbi:MAG: hypothetical protein QOH97_4341 [Actinoplanes sp.]|jgi:hypothetical protein|nr:hypothetical protein [Actinoplanes sp.]
MSVVVMTECEELSERRPGALVGTAGPRTVEPGREPGLSRVPPERAPAPATLAIQSGVDGRYARERIDHQAAAGLLTWT